MSHDLCAWPSAQLKMLLLLFVSAMSCGNPTVRVPLQGNSPDEADTSTG